MTHQGAIATSFAEFLNAPLLNVPQELTQALEPARKQASSLRGHIPHDNLLTQGHVEVNTATMDKTQLQALYERINAYNDPKLKITLLTQLQQERPDFKAQIDAKKFLQHTAFGQQYEAELLLQTDAIQAQELLRARKIPFTDYSGRTFRCSAYEYAYWAKDTHMCRMLERYMDEHTKSIMLKRVQKIEELVGDLFKTPRGLAYTQKGKEYRSAHFDLTPLKLALQTFIDAWLISPKQTPADFNAIDALWVKIGLPQRDVPAHIAQEYCYAYRSFADVVKNPKWLDVSNPFKLDRQLLVYNWLTYDTWFTPQGAEAPGLGTAFAISRGTEDFARGSCLGIGRYGCADIDLKAITAIEKARTEDLKQSLANLAAPLILQKSGLQQ